MTEYWFARYRPSALPQNTSRGLVPISWKGIAVIAGFVLSFFVGVAFFIFFMLRDQAQFGIPLWVICVIIGASTFIWASVAKTDPVKSIYDYRPDMQRRPVDKVSGETK